MREYRFLEWMAQNTQSRWWHDSADPQELAESIRHGAVGVTSNPFLIQSTLNKSPQKWPTVLQSCPPDLKGDDRAEKLLILTVGELAKQLMPIYEKSNGRDGYACAQVNPKMQGDAEAMCAQAKRYSRIAPNVSVKLPACSAGFTAMEECVAEGICTTITASFTVPQALAIGEHYKRGLDKASAKGISPKPCFAVLMIGRLDDYIRDIAHDACAQVSEEDIRKAGIAVAKRAYALYKQRDYKAVIMPAGMRGAYHVTELAGAEMIFSTAPKIQDLLENIEEPFCTGIEKPVDPGSLARLSGLKEFRRAYEPDGMDESEFLSYGATQRTLSQFVEAGWILI